MEYIAHYKIVESLGEGGMGKVYRAEDQKMGRIVAIKVLSPISSVDIGISERFEREARTIVSLSHSCIVPVYDYGKYNGKPYLVMRFMENGTLAERLMNGPLDVEQASIVLARIARGLDAAHTQAMIHRDVKPSNILFDSYDDAFLSDFGAVRLNHSKIDLTKESILGTPYYMAPEMIDRAELTSATDVYSLTVTFYQALTGRLPYEGDTASRVVMAHLGQPIPDVRQFRSDLPEAVTEVMRRGMAKSPEERFQFASELSVAFDRAISGSSNQLKISSAQPLASAAIAPTEVLPLEEVIIDESNEDGESAARIIGPLVSLTSSLVALLVILLLPLYFVVPLLQNVFAPRLPSRYFARAIDYAAQGEHHRAITTYSFVIYLDRREAGAYNNRGVQLRELDKHNRAINNFNKAIRRNNDYALPYANRAISYVMIDESDAALTSLEQFSDIEPEESWPYNSIAWIIVTEKNMPDAALPYIEQALLIEPNQPAALHTLGYIYLQMGNYEDAIDSFNQSIDVGLADYPEVYRDLGDASVAIEEYEGAIIFYERYLSEDPLTSKRGEIEEQIEDLNDLITQ